MGAVIIDVYQYHGVSVVCSKNIYLNETKMVNFELKQVWQGMTNRIILVIIITLKQCHQKNNPICGTFFNDWSTAIYTTYNLVISSVFFRIFRWRGLIDRRIYGWTNLIWPFMKLILYVSLSLKQIVLEPFFILEIYKNIVKCKYWSKLRWIWRALQHISYKSPVQTIKSAV